MKNTPEEMIYWLVEKGWITDLGHTVPQILLDIKKAGFDLKPRHPIAVSVLLCTPGSNAVLLGERITSDKTNGLLSTPGGRLELDENVIDCAVREFREECGAELCGKIEILCSRNHNRYGNHYFMFYIHATEYKGTIENLEPHKCKGWGWYDITHSRLTADNCTEPCDVLRMLEVWPDGTPRCIR